MPNPMLNDRILQRSDPAAAGGYDASPPSGFAPAPAWSEPATATMTIGGTCSASALMLVVVGIGAWFGWSKVLVTSALDPLGRAVSTVTMQQPGWLIGSILVGLALSFLTIFKPGLARFTALPYALAEGVALGIISHLYDAQSRGIAIQAVIATCGVFATMLLLYGLRVLRATPAFVKGVVAATVGVAAIYLVGIVARIFGADLGIFDSTSGLSILFSVVVVGIAAFNLILDFDFIERGAAEGLPKHMEWYGAFGLVLTIVWLYLEIIRLLSKLQRR